MGVKRRIDFVLCSSGLQLLDSRASYAIDLGSDHRSVVASFDLQQRRWNKTAKKKIVVVGSLHSTKTGCRKDITKH
jgi:hypothetical protein